MPYSAKVLVVGTTSDYIEWIRQSCPNEALFLTAPSIRSIAAEPRPEPIEEVCCDLQDYPKAMQKLESHMARHHLQIEGVACYDCESMELAAILACHLSLPYPSIQAVRNCRNKLNAKEIWRKQLLHTPIAAAVRSSDEAVRFFEKRHSPVVLKPVSGSGAELVFKCEDIETCKHHYEQLQAGLNKRRSSRLYAIDSIGAHPIMAEELAVGIEYSCDFAVRNSQVEIIRLTQKLQAGYGPFGTIQGYLLMSGMPFGIDEETLCRTLFQSASALGIERAVCMLDFIVDNGRIILLELAPRPGGDCLPFLLRRAYNLDMLKLQLDFSRKAALEFPKCRYGRSLVGIRLHARKNGTLKSIDTGELEKDVRLQEFLFIRKPGDRIALPPEDYDSWLLGHVIFTPNDKPKVEIQCMEILNKIHVAIQDADASGPPHSRDESSSPKQSRHGSFEFNIS